ncbi:MAG: hypothetical protein A4E65_03785 [Syntrophorhabdus sp. PtaU1.Bin153]|nr:MAG: hypothetical protein A4E65_03785 [Syntrophorhabdus sp. PtaU1.Bin153]
MTCNYLIYMDGILPHSDDQKEVSVIDRYTTKGLADYVIEQRSHVNTFLDRIDALIDRERIEKVLGKRYRKTASTDTEGLPRTVPLSMPPG